MVGKTDASTREVRDLIAGRIKDARLAAHMTQIDVAQLMKVSRVSYTIMESGKRSIPADIILQLAKIFEVNPLYLLGQSPDMLAPDDPKLLLAISEIHKLKPADLAGILDTCAKLGKGLVSKPEKRMYLRTSKNQRSMKPED
jgi:transcriptional regulator with XRE-family HTH domain